MRTDVQKSLESLLTDYLNEKKQKSKATQHLTVSESSIRSYSNYLKNLIFAYENKKVLSSLKDFDVIESEYQKVHKHIMGMDKSDHTKRNVINSVIVYLRAFHPESPAVAFLSLIHI